MISIINSQNITEFELDFKRRFFFSPDSKIASIVLYDANNDDALEVKLFIQDIYYQHYKAEINIQYPHLMALWDKNNNIIAAVGFRSAANNSLFLEQYLDEPIETILTKNYSKKITRDDIIEIGSLASIGGNLAKFLFISLAAYLEKLGYTYAVMTGTNKLQSSFRKLNLKPIIIGAADQNKLENKTDNWGSYYKTDPKIMAGNIHSGYKTLKNILGATLIPSFTKLYPYEYNL